jgi:predicted aspartyl protease
MKTTIGSLDNSGRPNIQITVAGAFPASAQQFVAMVDTGFTGFLSIPIMSALPLGLPLCGTTSVEFGDGNSSARFTALCSIDLGEEIEAGVAILEPSTTQIIVGMEFLRRFKKSIAMHRGVLVLLDESEIDKLIEQATAHAMKIPEKTAPALPMPQSEAPKTLEPTALPSAIPNKENSN